MRFGMVLPFHIANEARKRWAEASLHSLGGTRTDGLEAAPVLMFVVRQDNRPYNAEKVIRSHAGEFAAFQAFILPQPEDARSVDACLVSGWDYIVENHPDVTHLCMLCNDWLYNQRWLLQLRALILRRPHAKAWWVYHSTFEHYHKTLRADGTDVLVRSINSGGCFNREEYLSLGLDPQQCRRDAPGFSSIPKLDERTGRFSFISGGHKYDLLPGKSRELDLLPIQQGLTLDLYDPWIRPGERWVTKRSYIMNVGLSGYAQNLTDNEFAVDFAGVDRENNECC